MSKEYIISARLDCPFFSATEPPEHGGMYLCVTAKGELQMLWWNPKSKTWNRSGRLDNDPGLARTFAVDVTAWTFPEAPKITIGETK